MRNYVTATLGNYLIVRTEPDQKYRDHVTNSLNRSPWARVIKVPDFTDNGVCLIHTREPKAVRLVRASTRRSSPVLADLVARPDTPLSPAVKARILSHLCAAQGRFAALTRPLA